MDVGLQTDSKGRIYSVRSTSQSSGLKSGDKLYLKHIAGTQNTGPRRRYHDERVYYRYCVRRGLDSPAIS